MTRCGLIAVVTALVAGCSLLFAQTGDAPLSIQRIVIPPERVAKELEKVQQGTLLLLPRPEFDARVERARLAAQGREQRPRLTRAHYSAELIDRALTNGSGQWTIRHAGAAAVLPIDSLNLALAKVRWEQGGEAILAECDGKTLGLVVPNAGQASCLFDWSARGAPNNEGIAFTLAVPPCPISTFEFKLPADSWLVAPKSDAIVTGPHEAETPSKRLWKMQVAGAKPIELLVRKLVETTGPATTIFARVHSTQKLAPERIDIEHELQVDVLHGSVRELVLEGDAALQPYQVTLAGGDVKSWRWHELPAKKDAKDKIGAAFGLLTIQFHQPVQGKIQGLRIRSLGAPPAGGLWTSPGLRLRDAFSRGESLELHIRPTWPIGKWDHGSFQATQIISESDGTQVVMLAQTAGDAASSRRPALAAPLKDVDLYTTESYLWQIAPRGITLNAEIHYVTARGSLFALRVNLPKTFPDYQIEELDLQPAEMLGSRRREGDVLVVDLKQPLTPAKKATLRLKLRAGFRDLATGIRVLSYPELVPLDSTKRAGVVTVQVDPIFSPQLLSSSVPADPAGDAEPVRRMDAPSYRFTFRDQRVSAILRLIPQPVQAQLHGRHTILLTEQQASLTFRWDAEPLVGALEFLDFRLAPGFPTTWRVKEDPDGALQIHHWERLELQESLPHLLHLGDVHGPGAAALAALTPKGTYWRFHLSEPLRKRSGFTLEASDGPGQLDDSWRRVSLRLPSPMPWECVAGAMATDALPKSAGGRSWTVPLMVPVQTSNVVQEITIESPTEPIARVAADGSLTRESGATQAGKIAAQVRLGHTAGSFQPSTTISLTTRPEKRSASRFELCDEARLSTYVHKGGQAYCRIEFRLWHWHDRVCDLQLPAGFRVLAARTQDRWLQSLDISSSDAGVRLTLPVDQNEDFVRHEILVRWDGDATAVPGLRQIATGHVGCPIAPAEVRTRVFLDDGLMPIDPATLAPVGVPERIAGQSATARRLRQAWNWGRSWWPIGEYAELPAKLDDQRQIVLLEEAHLRAAANKPIKLGDALERLALDHLKNQTALVIDDIAFRSLGLNGATPVSMSARPFWEPLGLVYVPCPSGALLTSPRRLQALGIDGPLDTLELDEAVREAILHGCDASSGFFSIVRWLKRRSADAGVPTGSSAFEAFASMNEYELRGGGGAVDGFYVIEPVLARSVGWLIAILVTLFLWGLHRQIRPTSCFRVYAVLLAGSVLALIWSPLAVREFLVLPTLLVVAAAVVGCLVRLIARSGEAGAGGNSTVSHSGTGAVVLGLLCLSSPWIASAQVPAGRSHTVLVIEGARPTVLVPPELLVRLEEMEKPSEASGAVLVSARYLGKTRDTQTKFDVQFEIHSFQERATLIIPLTGVQLGEDAFLDGAPVFPAPHKAGYSLPIRGKGAHHLRLSFSVRARTENDQHYLRFTVPKLAQSEMTIQWLTPAQAVHCIGPWGEERTVSDARQFVKEWHAQIGYENNIKLRWNTAAAVPAPKTMSVREAHFWDLRPAFPTLVSSLQYSIGKGTLAQVQVALPEGLQVRGVEALTSSGAGPAAATIVKHWQITGKGDQRRLLIDFAQPATGQLTVNIEIVPPVIAQKNRLLRLPAPLQGESVAGWIAYRLDAAEIQRKAQNLVAVLRIGADEFEQQWKRQDAPTLPAGPPLSRAYSFQRKAANAWLDLITEPESRQALGTLHWTIDRGRIDLQGKLSISSPRDDLAIVECFVDKTMTLAAVTGPDVSRWYLQDSLLQIWLRQPRKETTVQLVGWRSLPAKTPAGKDQTLALPCVYPLQADLAAVTVEVQSAPGVRVKLDKSSHLRALSLPAPAEKGRAEARNLKYAVEEGPYQAAFKLSTEAMPVAASLLTKVQADQSSIEISHGIRLATQRGQLPFMRIHVKDWPLDAPPPDAPGAVVQAVRGKTPADRVWTLKYPAGLPEEVVVMLRARTPWPNLTDMPLPAVELEAASVRSRVIAWRNVELEQPASGKRLAAQKSIQDALAVFPIDNWLSKAAGWKAAVADQRLRIVLPRNTPSSNMRVLTIAEDAHWNGTGQWLHRVSCWVHVPEAAPLRIQFPAPVETLTVWVAGRLQSVWHAVGRDFVIPLEAGPDPRLIELRWLYEEGAEEVESPRVAAMFSENAAQTSPQRMVWIPPEMSPVKPAVASTPTLIARLAHEAKAHMEITAALAQESVRTRQQSNRLLAHQQYFHACIRQAEYALSLLNNERAQWRDRINELVSKNARLAKERGFETERAGAEKVKQTTRPGSAGNDRPGAGIPVLLSANLQTVTLQAVPIRTFSERRTHSYLLVLAAVILVVVSYIRHIWSMLRLASPEISIALIVVAMYVFGVSLIGLFFAVLMGLVRVLWLARYLRRRFIVRSAADVTPKAPSTMQPPPSTPA